MSSIPHSVDWTVSFLLYSAVEHMSATGLQPENIVSRLSKTLGGRLSLNKDSYVKIEADRVHLAITREGYKHT